MYLGRIANSALNFYYFIYLVFLANDSYHVQTIDTETQQRRRRSKQTHEAMGKKKNLADCRKNRKELCLRSDQHLKERQKERAKREKRLTRQQSIYKHVCAYAVMYNFNIIFRY